MLSLASSNIAMISVGWAHISERGMPLDLHHRRYFEQKKRL
jgi:hypothetical protein